MNGILEWQNLTCPFFRSSFHFIVFAPGYYKTNYRSLRFRELARMHGLRRAFSNYLITRFKRADGSGWMPGLWGESECSCEDLSEECRQAMKLHRSGFERLGFTECGFQKITKGLNPMVRDTGGIKYLDPSRRFFGQLHYHRVRVASTGADLIKIVIAFTAAFERGTLSCTNNKMSFDPLPENQVVRIDSYDVIFIHQQFQNLLEKNRETPREFPDHESLRQWFDARQIAAFEERVHRRIFIQMTEQEVAEAKARMAQADRGIFPAIPRRFRLAFWPVLIVLVVGLQFIRSRRGRTGEDTIEYRGEHFKMRKAYLTYEDYKDDPDNLDTNELNRIELAMTSAKIPSSFKDRNSMIKLIFDLEFPGYGVGGIGESAATDDGSVIEAESVEIPQRFKDRCVVVRQYHGEWNLVDDFVYGTATNTIRRVKLEKQTLRYYDQNGNLLREKHL
jgi:hypothetical protein